MKRCNKSKTRDANDKDKDKENRRDQISAHNKAEKSRGRE